MPLSFRGNGAFVVGSIKVFGFSFDVIPDTLKVEIDELFEKINLKVAELESSVTNLDSFVSFIEQYPSKGSEWFDVDMLIVASIAQKKYDEALSLIYNAKEKRGRARWGFGDNDFYDLAIMYAKQRK